MEWMNIDKDINQLQDTDFQYKENVFPLYNESNNIDWDNFINSKSSLSNNFDETSEIISVNNCDTKSTTTNQNKNNFGSNNNNSTINSTNSKNEINQIKNGDLNIDNKIQINFEELPLKERMRIKKEKTKRILERKTKRNEEDNNLIFQIPLNESLSKEEINQKNQQLSKKEIKMLRNRLSAQRSRDRKKQEFEYFKKLTQDLFQENMLLNEELKKSKEKINQLTNSIQFLCPNCKKIMNEKNLSLSDCSLNKNNSNIGKKYTLLTGLLTVLCVFGTLILGNNNNNSISNNINNNINNNELRKVSENIEKNFSGLIAYKDINDYINKIKENENNLNKQIQIPFQIEKDYTLRMKKNEQKNKMMVPLSYYKGNSIKKNDDINQENNFEQNLPLICKDIYSSIGKSEKFFNNLYQEKLKDKSITHFNLRGDKYNKKIENKNLFLELIIPSEKLNNNNETRIQVDKKDEENYKISCKIFDIKKEYKY
jgi:hypothetical protein